MEAQRTIDLGLLDKAVDKDAITKTIGFRHKTSKKKKRKKRE